MMNTPYPYISFFAILFFGLIGWLIKAAIDGNAVASFALGIASTLAMTIIIALILLMFSRQRDAQEQRRFRDNATENLQIMQDLNRALSTQAQAQNHLLDGEVKTRKLVPSEPESYFNMDDFLLDDGLDAKEMVDDSS